MSDTLDDRLKFRSAGIADELERQFKQLGEWDDFYHVPLRVQPVQTSNRQDGVPPEVARNWYVAGVRSALIALAGRGSDEEESLTGPQAVNGLRIYLHRLERGYCYCPLCIKEDPRVMPKEEKK